MRGLWSTVVLVFVLAGLLAYIYFVTNKKSSADTGSKEEKVFASVQNDKIDTLRIRSASGDTTTAKKENGNWKIVDPIAAPADDTELGSIANALTSVGVTRVVDENPANLNDYGLSEPRIDVGFKATGDQDFRHLYIGEKSPTGSDLFAKRGTEKRVFLIPAYEETTFNRSTFELRDKKILKFDRDKVDAVEIDAGGKPLDIAKSGTDWKIAKPVQVRADYGSVEGLIGRLQNAQMKSIVTNDSSPADLKKYDLERPTATATLKMGSARATLLLGGKADDNTVYARDSSRPAVMTVESSLADELKKGADEYRRKDIFEFRSYNANRIEIARNGQTFVFEKVKGQGNNPDKWRRASPNAADVDKDKMESLLSRLSNMRASSFVDSTAKTGLDAPAMTVSVRFDDEKKDERVTFGKTDSDAFAARLGEPGAAKIEANDLTEATKTLDELAK